MRFRPAPPPRAHHRLIAATLVLVHVVVHALFERADLAQAAGDVPAQNG